MIRTFSFTIIEDKELKLSSTNDGFSSIELLGFIDWKREDILMQM